MTFSKVSDSTNVYMCESDLSKDSTVSKICYVINKRYGQTWAKDGFYKLLLKTIDDMTFNGMVFNLSNFIYIGLDMNKLVGKFIRVTGQPQIYNGKYSFIIDKIEIVVQDEIPKEIKSAFIGTIENLEQVYDDCYKLFNSVGKVLPVDLKFKYYGSIYNGKIGGYLKLLSDWSFMVMSCADSYGESIIKYLVETSLIYRNYLDLIDNSSVVTEGDKVKILMDATSNGFKEISVDASRGILGVGKPEHLFANIISECFNTCFKISNMKGEWKSIPAGGVLLSKDYCLKKY